MPAAAYSDPDLGLDEDNLFWVTNAAHAGEVLATVHACSNGSPDANARLMAAAPDLLAALRELNRAWNATQFPCSERMDAALQDADAAIAKAEGTK